VLKKSPSETIVVGSGIEPMPNDITASWVWTIGRPSVDQAYAMRTAFLAHLAAGSEAGTPSDFADAELILTELVANVHRHATGDARAYVVWTLEHPRLLVVDRGPGFTNEPATTLADPFAESGRGLAIARMLARDFGCGNRRGGGAYVYATLPLRRAHAMAS
jgi:anti-sigma regulatory factor (Ser/Thr protein kinase)